LTTFFIPESYRWGSHVSRQLLGSAHLVAKMSKQSEQERPRRLES
jgi:hypothetical protein